MNILNSNKVRHFPHHEQRCYCCKPRDYHIYYQRCWHFYFCDQWRRHSNCPCWQVAVPENCCCKSGRDELDRGDVDNVKRSTDSKLSKYDEQGNERKIWVKKNQEEGPDHGDYVHWTKTELGSELEKNKPSQDVSSKLRWLRNQRICHQAALDVFHLEIDKIEAETAGWHQQDEADHVPSNLPNSAQFFLVSLQLDHLLGIRILFIHFVNRELNLT